jgi:phosphate-selective porin OprO/OprP
MFFSEVWDSVPEPLELALRHASVDPDQENSSGVERESTISANWYIKGHRNKLTADVSRIDREQTEDKETEKRFRVQWDVSF